MDRLTWYHSVQKTFNVCKIFAHFLNLPSRGTPVHTGNTPDLLPYTSQTPLSTQKYAPKQLKLTLLPQQRPMQAGCSRLLQQSLRLPLSRPSYPKGLSSREP